MAILLMCGSILVIEGDYTWGYIFILVFVLVALGHGYYWGRQLLFSHWYTEKLKEREKLVLEEISDEEAIQSVDVKFDLFELGSKNTFLLIQISSSFIDGFKKYNLSLNSPSLLGKKIYEWGDCDNGMCTQNVLCFSKDQIKSTVEQVSNEVQTAIEWLPNGNGEQSVCIQKWVKFEWK